MMDQEVRRTKLFLFLIVLLLVVIFFLSLIIFIISNSQFDTLRFEMVSRSVTSPSGDTMYHTNEEEEKIIQRIYEITKEKDFYDPTDLTSLRVPSGSNFVYKVYQWINEFETEKKYLSKNLKIAIADLLWFFQERDIHDDYLGNCDVPGTGDDWKTNTWAGYYQHFVPTIGCDTVYRAGLMGDGGKHLCNVHKILQDKEPCMVYSFGANTDISFDNQMYYLLNCNSHCFDPTISKYQIEQQLHNEKHIRFHDYGIGPDKYGGWSMAGKELKTLTKISEELGVEKVDILKVDVEGTEISAFQHMFNEEDGIVQKLGVKIILVEYHSPAGFAGAPPFDCHLRKTHLYPFLKNFYDNGFYMYRFEHNVFGIPCIEYGFVHKDLI